MDGRYRPIPLDRPSTTPSRGAPSVPPVCHGAMTGSKTSSPSPRPDCRFGTTDPSSHDAYDGSLFDVPDGVRSADHLEQFRRLSSHHNGMDLHGVVDAGLRHALFSSQDILPASRSHGPQLASSSTNSTSYSTLSRSTPRYPLHQTRTKGEPLTKAPSALHNPHSPHSFYAKYSDEETEDSFNGQMRRLFHPQQPATITCSHHRDQPTLPHAPRGPEHLSVSTGTLSGSSHILRESGSVRRSSRHGSPASLTRMDKDLRSGSSSSVSTESTTFASHPTPDLVICLDNPVQRTVQRTPPLETEFVFEEEPLLWSDTPAEVPSRSPLSRSSPSDKSSGTASCNGSMDPMRGARRGTDIPGGTTPPPPRRDSNAARQRERTPTADTGTEAEDHGYRQTIADGCCVLYWELSGAYIADHMIDSFFLQESWFSSEVLVFSMCLAQKVKSGIERTPQKALPQREVRLGDAMVLLALFSLACKLHGDLSYSAKSLVSHLENSNSAPAQRSIASAKPLSVSIEELCQMEWRVWQVTNFDMWVDRMIYDRCLSRVIKLGTSPWK